MKELTNRFLKIQIRTTAVNLLQAFNQLDVHQHNFNWSPIFKLLIKTEFKKLESRLKKN